MDGHGVVILIEVVMVFGGALAFGWWQLRDLKRERLKREVARLTQAAASSSTEPQQGAATRPQPQGDPR
jgi:hypothetical protein